jgi:drug/metabolite transporter (DMT)-like permease
MNSAQSDAHRPNWLVFAPAMFLFVWSPGYVAAKFGLGYIDPFTFLALRYGVIVIIMTALYLIIRPPLPKTGRDWMHLAIVGILMQTIYFGFCYMAFNQGIAVGTLSLLLSLQPILVGLIAPRWSGERVGLKQWGGLVLGLLGAAVVIIARSGIEPASLLSFCFAFFGLIGITGASLWEKRFGTAHHPVTSNFVGFAVGFVSIMPFVLMFETINIVWRWELTVSLIWLVLGSSLMGVGLLLAMIRAGDVAKVSALFFMVPPLAAFFAWIVLGEIMPPLAWVGMGIAAIGVYIATRKTKLNIPTKLTTKI